MSASGLAEAMAADARLIVLRELASQTDGRLNELLLRRVLDDYGIRRDRDWIRTQLRKLEALGAIALRIAGETMIAEITRAGRDHVEARSSIEGVSRPSDVD